jgi:hypothetical protein
MESEKEFLQTEEKPPILKTWNRIYLLVILNLIFCLTLFYIIRRIFE